MSFHKGTPHYAGPLVLQFGFSSGWKLRGDPDFEIPIDRGLYAAIRILNHVSSISFEPNEFSRDFGGDAC